MKHLDELLGASMAVTLRVTLEQSTEELADALRDNLADLNVTKAEKIRIVQTFKSSMDTRLTALIKELDGEDE